MCGVCAKNVGDDAILLSCLCEAHKKCVFAGKQKEQDKNVRCQACKKDVVAFSSDFEVESKGEFDVGAEIKKLEEIMEHRKFVKTVSEEEVVEFYEAAKKLALQKLDEIKKKNQIAIDVSGGKLKESISGLKKIGRIGEGVRKKYHTRLAGAVSALTGEPTLFTWLRMELKDSNHEIRAKTDNMEGAFKQDFSKPIKSIDSNILFASSNGMMRGNGCSFAFDLDGNVLTLNTVGVAIFNALLQPLSNIKIPKFDFYSAVIGCGLGNEVLVAHRKEQSRIVLDVYENGKRLKQVELMIDRDRVKSILKIGKSRSKGVVLILTTSVMYHLNRDWDVVKRQEIHPGFFKFMDDEGSVYYTDSNGFAKYECGSETKETLHAAVDHNRCRIFHVDGDGIVYYVDGNKIWAINREGVTVENPVKTAIKEYTPFVKYNPKTNIFYVKQDGRIDIFA